MRRPQPCLCEDIPWSTAGNPLQIIVADGGSSGETAAVAASHGVEMIKRLRRYGKLVITKEHAPTSARRWQRGGIPSTWTRHQLILAGYALGISQQQPAKPR